MNVKYPLKYKIFAVIFFIQIVVISIFIFSFVKSFKQEKLTLAYELNASTIAELKTKFESKVFMILEKVKATTGILEKNQLKKTEYADYLDLKNDKSVESFFHYEVAQDLQTNDEKLNLIEKFDKIKTPEMNDYFSKIYQNNKNGFPFFWNFEWAERSYTGLGFILSYTIPNQNGVNENFKRLFFIIFNKKELFRLKTENQLADTLVFTKSGQIIHSSSSIDVDALQSWIKVFNFKDSFQNQNLVQVSEQMIDQKNHLVSSQVEGFGDLLVATLISTDKAFAGVKSVYINAFILAAFSILFSYILALYLSASITRPISYLTQQMQNVSKGQLEVVVDIQSKDEVGVLALNFKQMTLDLKVSKQELVDLNLDLENKVAERTKQLEELSIKDALTGAYNRRYFDQKVAEEISRANRTKRSIGLLYLDIDHFKKYNDQNGHPEGDQLLINFVKTVQAIVRTSDYFCRLGGEEFCVITVEADVEGTKILAEKVREKIYSTDFKFGEKQPMGRLSCSIGLSMYPDFSESADTLVKSADLALYNAKQGGRNRWVMATEKTFENPTKAS